MAIETPKLNRLTRLEQLTESDGRPTVRLMAIWQDAMLKIEAAFAALSEQNDIQDDLITQLAATVDAVAAAQAAAAAADAAAVAAQAAADSANASVATINTAIIDLDTRVTNLETP